MVLVETREPQRRLRMVGRGTNATVKESGRVEMTAAKRMVNRLRSGIFAGLLLKESPCCSRAIMQCCKCKSKCEKVNFLRFSEV